MQHLLTLLSIRVINSNFLRVLKIDVCFSAQYLRPMVSVQAVVMLKKVARREPGRLLCFRVFLGLEYFALSYYFSDF